MNMIYDRMRVALCVIACVLLSYLFYRSLILPIEWPEDYSERMLIVMIGIYMIGLTVVTLIVRRIPERAQVILVGIMLVGAFCVQVYIAHEMQLMPDVDLKYIREQNRFMVENGLHQFTDEAYFAANTNNIGLAIIIYWVFRIARLCGLANCELAGGLFNVCMNMLTYICAYRIVRRYSSSRVATVFLFYLVSNPVLYAYASYYYTDTVSMGLTALAVDLFLTGKDVYSGNRQRILLVLSGFVMLIAFRVRVTSLFIVLAAIAYGILRVRSQQMLRLGVPFLIGVLAALVCYSGLYHYHIGFDTTEQALPWQSFVAMGTDGGGDGRYNVDIRAAVLAEPDHQSKVDLSMQIIKENVRENGFLGSLSLILRKESVVWSRGTKMYFQYVPFVKDKNPIYEWIIGEHAEYLANYMQAYNTLFLLLIIASLASSLVRGKLEERQTILVIYWLGAALFYVFWEAHPRQSVSYLALMSMMLVPLLEQMCCVRHRESHSCITGV